MDGLPNLTKPQAGDDVRDLYKVVIPLVDFRDANWTVELPAGGTLTAKFNAGANTVTLDFSKLGVVVTGCLNGAPGYGTALYCAPPQKIP